MSPQSRVWYMQCHDSSPGLVAVEPLNELDHVVVRIREIEPADLALNDQWSPQDRNLLLGEPSDGGVHVVNANRQMRTIGRGNLGALELAYFELGQQFQIHVTCLKERALLGFFLIAVSPRFDEAKSLDVEANRGIQVRYFKRYMIESHRVPLASMLVVDKGVVGISPTGLLRQTFPLDRRELTRASFHELDEVLLVLIG